MGFFHYTDLAIDEASRGRVLRTVPGRHSLYWRSVFAPQSYDAAVETARQLHPAVEGGVLERVAGCRYLQRCLSELLFESVRVSLDANLPSRSECLFLLPTPDVSMNLNVAGRTLLEIEPQVDARLFRARASLLDGSFFVQDITARAREYWRGSNGPDDEVLFVGEFKVLRVVGRPARGITLDGQGFAELHPS